MKNVRSLLAPFLFAPLLALHAADKPNIVFILADDLGYGDVHCLNPDRCKIATPCLDKLASQGMTLTDAHSTSAVCSPSRYGILTGRYNWRSRLQGGVVTRYGSALISKNRLTVANLLKQQGYDTACFGKWHLGWDWPKQGGQIDFTQPIKSGPTSVGFDYYFGTDIPNWTPHCFIENEHTVGIPVPGKKGGNDVSVSDWNEEAMLPTFTAKTCDYIAAHANTGKPFFVYLALPSPHTPLVPTKEWRGKSGLGEYGDYVMETDWAVGQVLAALDKAGAADNTLVMFSSDNGVAPYVGVDSEQLQQLEAKGFNKKEAEKGGQSRFKELEAMGHFSSGEFRGHKSDIWDGGHRVPTFVRWPGKVQPGSTGGQLVSLVDFMATCADIVQAKIPDNAAEDSLSMMPVLTGKAAAPVNEAVVFHSINGSFGIQQGNWKLELCAGSGGWGHPNQKESKGLPPVQLYDMSKDISERTNEEGSHPEIVSRLTKLLEKYVADGRSTPGPVQKNDVKVDIWKKNLSNKEQNGD